MMRFMMRTFGGEGFGSVNLHLRALIKCFIIQKVFRINSHVPWPVHWTSTIKDPRKIQRGTRFPGLAISCHLDGRNGITIEDNVWIGPRVTIVSKNHDMLNYNDYLPSAPVVIGRNSWLAANVVILPGVVLGEHTVVAAGAVVTKSFPEGNQVLVGCPARVAKKLGAYEGL